MKLVASAGLVPTSARSLPGFALRQPRDLDEALACLAESPGCVLLAGGTDLVAQYNEGLVPEVIVDLSRVAALREVDLADGQLRIGALVTHHAGSTNELVRRAVPGFAEAWSKIANPRIRFRATLGGNLMARRTRYEGAILLTALEARARVATTRDERESDVQSLWDAAGGSTPLLKGVSIDARNVLAFRYERSLRPLMTQAMALRSNAAGLRVSCAIATEYLRPVHLAIDLPGMRVQDMKAGARQVAADLFGQLPSAFEDAVVTHGYALRAGRVLLRRQLENIHV